MEIKTILKKAVMSWGIATLIVMMMAWIIIHNFVDKNEPCNQKPCYQLLDARMKIIELIMECPNNECDRFKGADAKLMEKRLQAETDAKIEALRKELNK